MRRLRARFAYQLCSRLAMEAVLVRVSPWQRRGAEEPDPMIAVLMLASNVAVPVMATIGLTWLVTGRGPGGRWFAAGRGAPRQRP